MIPTLWAIITIKFFIVQIAPGGPVDLRRLLLVIPTLWGERGMAYPLKLFATATYDEFISTLVAAGLGQ